MKHNNKNNIDSRIKKLNSSLSTDTLEFISHHCDDLDSIVCAYRMPKSLGDIRNLKSIFENGIRTTTNLDNICYAEDGNYIDTASFAIPDDNHPNVVLAKLPISAFYTDSPTPILLPKKDKFDYISGYLIPSQFILGAINGKSVIANPNYTEFPDYTDLVPIDCRLSNFEKNSGESSQKKYKYSNKTRITFFGDDER